MKMLLDEQRAQLVRNHENNYEYEDYTPVVKLFVCVGGNATWLLTELDPDSNIAFGLCDLGLGFPEVGSVDLTELEEAMGWRLERDRHWTATQTLSEYASDARAARMIVA